MDIYKIILVLENERAGGERRMVEMGGEMGGRAYKAMQLVEAIDDVNAL